MQNCLSRTCFGEDLQTWLCRTGFVEHFFVEGMHTWLCKIGFVEHILCKICRYGFVYVV